MDVRMPDGTVIKNVPEGTTQEDLQAQLNAHKFNTGSKVEARAEQERMLSEVMGKKRPGVFGETRGFFGGPKSWGTGYGPATTELGGKVTDVTGSPELGYGSKVLMDLIPSLLTMTRGLPGPSPTIQAHNARIGEQGKILEKGKDLGLAVPPTMANPGAVNRTLESVGGKAATSQASALRNQGPVYAIAQREAGISPGTAITDDALEAARKQLAQPYREIQALEPKGALAHPPFKSPTKTLEEIQSLRAQAKDTWLHYNTIHDPLIKNKALELSGKADELETTLDAYARQANRPDLVEKLQEARQALAKNYTVQRAMTGSSFDPSKLSQLESRGKAPLTGDLETVMQMYREFPGAMKPPQAGGSPGVNQLLPWITAPAGGYLGSMVGGTSGGAAGATMGLAAGQAIPPAVRSLILSDLYQSLMANPKAVTNPAVLQGVAGNPLLANELQDWFKNK